MNPTKTMTIDTYNRLCKERRQLRETLKRMVEVFNQTEIDPLQAFVMIEQAQGMLDCTQEG